MNNKLKDFNSCIQIINDNNKIDIRKLLPYNNNFDYDKFIDTIIDNPVIQNKFIYNLCFLKLANFIYYKINKINKNEYNTLIKNIKLITTDIKNHNIIIQNYSEDVLEKFINIIHDYIENINNNINNYYDENFLKNEITDLYSKYDINLPSIDNIQYIFSKNYYDYLFNKIQTNYDKYYNEYNTYNNTSWLSMPPINSKVKNQYENSFNLTETNFQKYKEFYYIFTLIYKLQLLFLIKVYSITYLIKSYHNNNKNLNIDTNLYNNNTLNDIKSYIYRHRELFINILNTLNNNEYKNVDIPNSYLSKLNVIFIEELVKILSNKNSTSKNSSYYKTEWNNFKNRYEDILNKYKLLLDKSSIDLDKLSPNRSIESRNILNISLEKFNYYKNDNREINKTRVYQEYIEAHKHFNTLFSYYANDKEDLGESVRVYVRVKPINKGDNSVIQQTNNNDKDNLIINCQNGYKSSSTTYTTNDNFLKIFNENQSTQDIYNKTFKSVLNQVVNGYSIILFGYGYSGSGKTYTLLGGNGLNNTEGLFQILLNDHTFLDQCSEISIKTVFELYVDYGLKINDVYGNIIKNDGKKTTLDECFNEKNKIIFSKNSPLDTNNLNIILNKINNNRVNSSKARIKTTINNPESSRSHLFIVLEIVNNKNEKGFLTICDMAGREDPLDIFSKYCQVKKPSKNSVDYVKYNFDTLINTNLNVLGKQELLNNFSSYARSIKDLLKLFYFKDIKLSSFPKFPIFSQIKENDQINYAANFLYIIKEGLFINETINHLKYYFAYQIDPSKKYKDIVFQPGIFSQKPIYKILPKTDDNPDGLSLYKTDNVFNDPSIEFNNVLNKTNNDKNTKVHMIEILDKLKNLTQESSKPTKFIMLCCVRQEKNYCEDIKKTLEFVKSISTL